EAAEQDAAADELRAHRARRVAHRLALLLRARRARDEERRERWQSDPELRHFFFLPLSGAPVRAGVILMACGTLMGSPSNGMTTSIEFGSFASGGGVPHAATIAASASNDPAMGYDE